MAKMRFVLNVAGVGDLLKSADMIGVISDATQEVASRARSFSGQNYVGDVIIGKTRAVGHVSAGDDKAYRENLKHNYLLKALGG